MPQTSGRCVAFHRGTASDSGAERIIIYMFNAAARACPRLSGRVVQDELLTSNLAARSATSPPQLPVRSPSRRSWSSSRRAAAVLFGALGATAEHQRAKRCAMPRAYMHQAGITSRRSGTLHAALVRVCEGGRVRSG